MWGIFLYYTIETGSPWRRSRVSASLRRAEKVEIIFGGTEFNSYLCNGNQLNKI